MKYFSYLKKTTSFLNYLGITIGHHIKVLHATCINWHVLNFFEPPADT
jgi:hypothetical protein